MGTNDLSSKSPGKQILEDLLAGKIRPHDQGARSIDLITEYLISVLHLNPSHNVDAIRGLREVSNLMADIVLKRIAQWLVSNRVVFDDRAGLTNTLSSWLMLRLVQHQSCHKEKSLDDFEKELLPRLPPLPRWLRDEFGKEMAWLRLAEVEQRCARKVA